MTCAARQRAVGLLNQKAQVNVDGRVDDGMAEAEVAELDGAQLPERLREPEVASPVASLRHGQPLSGQDTTKKTTSVRTQSLSVTIWLSIRGSRDPTAEIMP